MSIKKTSEQEKLHKTGRIPCEKREESIERRLLCPGEIWIPRQVAESYVIVAHVIRGVARQGYRLIRRWKVSLPKYLVVCVSSLDSGVRNETEVRKFEICHITHTIGEACPRALIISDNLGRTQPLTHNWWSMSAEHECSKFRVAFGERFCLASHASRHDMISLR